MKAMNMVLQALDSECTNARKSHTKSFEISKLAFENISDLYA